MFSTSTYKLTFNLGDIQELFPRIQQVLGHDNEYTLKLRLCQTTWCERDNRSKQWEQIYVDSCSRYGVLHSVTKDMANSMIDRMISSSFRTYVFPFDLHLFLFILKSKLLAIYPEVGIGSCGSRIQFEKNWNKDNWIDNVKLIYEGRSTCTKSDLEVFVFLRRIREVRSMEVKTLIVELIDQLINSSQRFDWLYLKEHEYIMDLFQIKADILDELQKYDEAVKVRRIIYEIRCEQMKLSGKKPQGFLYANKHFIRALMKSGNYEEAWDLIIDMGSDTLAHIAFKGVVYDLNTGGPERCEFNIKLIDFSMKTKNLEDMSQLKKDEDGETVKMLGIKADALLGLKKYDEGMELWKNIYEINKKWWGETNYRTLDAKKKSRNPRSPKL